MAGWSVQGNGAEIAVTSAGGDVYPFHIACVAELRLELSHAPSWQAGRPPADADLRINEALDEASRWAQDMFGPARSERHTDRAPRSAATSAPLVMPLTGRSPCPPVAIRSVAAVCG